ncbi:MAG: DUF4231 domain-containing protein [Symploca sp. SIO2D2]|nr:DUF4231 domain-containing protein [Symploca sp. SIO2D2]NER24800.1 DUF4231 domain-containing protein [Symploca sp. SIO1C2]
MAKNAYQEYLKQQFTELIDELELSDLQKRFMKSRWLDQLLWLEGKSGGAKKWSNRLRLMIIVGGVLIPALVSLNFNDNQLGVTIGWVTFGLSQVVAISAAVEEYFHFSDKYTQYRQTAECLKSEAWQFFQLSGSYKDYPSHMQAYSSFAFRIEQFIQKDVQTFVEVAKETAKQEQKQQENLEQNLPSWSKGVSTSKTSNVSVSKNDADFEPQEKDD